MFKSLNFLSITQNLTLKPRFCFFLQRIITFIMYIYIYIYGEIVDFGKSDKIMKISGKVNKPTLTTDSAMMFHSLFKKKKNFVRMKNGFFKSPATEETDK